MPEVTVLMAAHNASATIADAINSIRNQSLEDWELIVIDDASDDDTVEIARRFASMDFRVRVLELAQNGGAGFARNHGLKIARADYVAIMDADDISLPRRLSAQLEYMQTHDTVAVSSQVADFGTWGGPVVGHWPTDARCVSQRQARCDMPLPHPAAFFRRAEIVAAGGYDEVCRRAEDYALMLRLGRAPMACLPEVQVLYRTERPVKLAYALASGRDGALARRRHVEGDHVTSLSALTRLQVDLRSCATWARRRIREGRQ